MTTDNKAVMLATGKTSKVFSHALNEHLLLPHGLYEGGEIEKGGER